MNSVPKLDQSHFSVNHSAVQAPLTFHSCSFSPITASFSPSPKHTASLKPPLTPLLKTLTPLVKPTCIAIAATAFFLTRLRSPPLAAAEPLLPPPQSQTLSTDPQSVIGDLIKTRKFDEAIRFLDRQIELDPEELEYPLLKAHLHMHTGEPELAVSTFEYLLKKEPFDVDAYRGLLRLTSETKKGTKSTEELLKRIEEVVRVLEEQERDSDVREFKLLIAQVKIIDGDLSGALKVYEELEKTEPEDYRPYFCQGVVYGMLKMEDEAEKQFEKYRALVGEDHPCNKYFEDSTEILDEGGVSAKS